MTKVSSNKNNIKMNNSKTTPDSHFFDEVRGQQHILDSSFASSICFLFAFSLIHHHVLLHSSPSVSPFCLVCIVHFSFMYLTFHHPTCHLPSRNLAFIPALCSITLAPNLPVSLQSCISSSTLTFTISLSPPHPPLFFFLS